MSKTPDSFNTEYLSSKEAAKLADCTIQHISRLCREGSVDAKKKGRSWVIEKNSLLKYLDQGTATEEEFFTSRDAAAFADYTVHHISRLCRSGEIDAFKEESGWKISEESLENYLEETNKKQEEYRDSLARTYASQLTEVEKRNKQKDLQEQEIQKAIGTISSPVLVPQRKLTRKTVATASGILLVMTSLVAYATSPSYSQMQGRLAAALENVGGSELQGSPLSGLKSVARSLYLAISGDDSYKDRLAQGSLEVVPTPDPALTLFPNGSLAESETESSEDVLVVAPPKVIERVIYGQTSQAGISYSELDLRLAALEEKIHLGDENLRELIGDIDQNVTQVAYVDSRQDENVREDIYETLSVSISTGYGTFSDYVTIKGDLVVDTDTLFVDSERNRVGIGTDSPRALFDVGGVFSVAADGTITASSSLVSSGLDADNATTTNLFTSNLTATGTASTSNLVVSNTATFSSATSSRLLSLNASQELTSTDLSQWITGTTNQVTVSDDTDGTITLSLPQDIHTTATPTFDALTLATTTATSTIAGGFNVGSGGLVYDYSSGNVGIGTSVSPEKLTIVGGGIQLDDNQNLQWGDIGTAIDGSSSLDYLRFFTSAQERVRVDSNGNVGIGTTSPGYPLDVNGDVRIGEAGSTNALFVDATNGKVGIGTNSPADTLTILPTSAGVGLTIRESDDENDAVSLQGNEGNGNVVLYGGGGSARVVLRGAGDSFFNPSSGNVGIGTTSPMSKLSVNSTGTQLTLAYDDSNYSNITTNSSGQLNFDSTGNQINLGDGTYYIGEQNGGSSLYSLKLSRSAGGGIIPDIYGGSGLVFGADSSENSQLVLEDGGNVGVGTSSPYAKLSVVGEVVSEYFTATSTTATTTLAGGLNVGSGGFVYDLSTGNVGIGTTSPAARFVITHNNSGGESNEALSVDSSTNDSTSVAAHFKNSDLDSLLYVRSDGQVGIGTTNLGAYGLNLESGPLRVGGDRIFFSEERGFVYDDGLNAIGIVMDGTTDISNSSFYFDNFGRLGIGTTSPYAPLSVEGQVAADYFTAVDATATSSFAGDVILGTGSSNVITVNGLVGSSLVPSQNQAYDLGAPAGYWGTLYVDEIVANNLGSASTTIAGTQSSTFTLNTDNATADAEDITLTFYRGTVSPNATLNWNSTSDRFEFNQDLFIQDATAGSGSTNLTIQAGVGQSGNLFDIEDNSGNSLFSVSDAGVASSSSAVVSNAFTFSSGTASRLLSLNGSNQLTSTDLSSWITGTANQVTVTDDADGTVTLSLPQDIHTDAAPTFDALTLDNASATSTIAGGLNVGSGGFVYDYSSGNVGIGTTEAGTELDVDGQVHIGTGNRSAASTFPLYISDGSNLGWKVADSAGNAKFELYVGYSGTNEMRLLNDVSLVGYNQDLVLESNNSDVLLNPTQGNVGIGTTSPGAKLDVVGGSIAFDNGGGSALQIRDSGEVYRSVFGYSGSTWSSGGGDELWIRNPASGGKLNFAYSTSPEVTFDLVNGRVGIGTTTPTEELSIDGHLLVDGVVGSSDSSIYTRNSFFRLSSGGAGNDKTRIELQDSNISFMANSGGNLSFGEDTGTFQEYLTVESGGQVGIGTTSPASLLHLESSSPTITLIDSDAPSYTSTISATSGAGGLFLKAAGYLTLSTAGSERFRIQANGNVGIGTTSPDYPLDVNGDFRVGEAGSTNALFVDATNGRVGVGTNSPNDRLEVSGGDIRIQEDDGSNARELLFDSNYPDAHLKSQGSGADTLNFTLGANNEGNASSYDSTRLLLTSKKSGNSGSFYFDHADESATPSFTTLMKIEGDTGNVGIGTTTTSGRLSIQGSGSNIANFIDSNGITRTSIASDGDISFYTSGSHGLEWGTAELRFTGEQEGIRIKPYGNSYAGLSILGLSGQTGNLFQVNSDGNNDGDLFVVDADGDVGIGTTTPSTDFAVNGDGYFTGGLGVGVATTTDGEFRTAGDAYIGGSLTVAGSLTSSITNGQIQFLAVPTGTGIDEGTVYVNPPSAGTNNVLLGLAVNGTEKARIDAEGDVQITGLFNSINTVGTNALAGGLSVDGNTTLGDDEATDILSLNARITGNILPSADSTYNLGSEDYRFANIYAATTTIDNLVAGGTASSTFILNQTNATADSEDSSLEFERGSVTPNAIVKWDSNNTRFDLNQDVYLQNELTVAGTGTSTIAGLLELTRTPTGSGLNQGALYINPSSAAANRTLFGIGVAGVERLRVDAEGDTTIQASLGIENALYDISQDTLTINDSLKINGGEIKDSGDTTRISLGSTNTITGILSVNGNVLPSADSTHDLGADATRWATVYADAIDANTFSTNLTEGSVAFVDSNGDLAEDNSNFFWDDTADRLGIGVITPVSQLHIENSDSIDFDNDAHTGEGLFIKSSGVGAGVGNPTGLLAFGKHDSSSDRTGAGIAGIQTSSDADNIGLAFYTSPSSASSQTLTQQMIITHDGNVGIGTTSPGANLDITSSSGVASLRLAETTGTDHYWELQSTNSNPSSGLLFNQWTEGAGLNTRLAIDTNGNVGIGTTSPAAKLHVSGGDILINNNTSLLGYDASGNPRDLIGTDTGDNLIIGSTGLDDVIISAGNVTAVTVKETSGNVGIGTTSPKARLEVDIARTTGGNYDGVLIHGTQTNNIGGGNNYAFTVNGAFNASAGTDRVSQVYVKNPTLSGTNQSVRGITVDKIAGGGQGSAQIFLSNNTSGGSFNSISGQYALFSDNTADSYFAGDVGIGTSDPDYTLEVTGTGYFSSNLYGAGIINLNSGSAGTPAFTFNDDSDTGVFRPTTNELAFSTGASERLRLDANGNVGIGTTTPDSPFVIQSVSANPTLWAYQTNTVNSSGETLRLQRTLDAADSINKITFYDKSEYAADIRTIRDGSSTNWDLAFLTGSGSSSGGPSEQLRITSSGNVGIGTTSPGHKLSVSGSAFFDGGTVTASTFTATSSISAPYFTATDASATSTFAGGLNIDSGGLVYDYSSGNVGIGTESPSASLVVAPSSGTAEIRLDASGSNQSRLGLYRDGSRKWNIYNDYANDNLVFYDSDGVNMVIQQDGNVGIGTTTPEARLETTDVLRVLAESGPSFPTSGAGIEVLFDSDRDAKGGVGSGGDGAGIVQAYDRDGSAWEDLSIRGNNIVFSANGSVVTTIQSDGSVGIGTADPVSALHVSGSAFATTTGATGVFIDSGDITAGSGNFGAGLEFSKLGSNTVKKAAIVPVQESADDDALGLAFFVSSSATQADPVMEALRISYGSGRVGIGTESPDTKLEVAGNIRATSGDIQINTSGQFQGQSGSAGTPSYSFLADTDTGIYSPAENELAITTGSSEALRVDSAGNVGIGATDPIKNLHVKDDTSSQLLIETDSSVGATSTLGFKVALDDNDSYIKGGIIFERTGADAIGSLHLATNNFADASNVTEEDARLTITADGLVGIGNTSPSHDLHIGSGASGVAQSLAIESNVNSTGSLLFLADDESNRFDIVADTDASPANDTLSIREQGNDVLTITGGGKVGIGTTSPDTKLHVLGTTQIGDPTTSNGITIEVGELYHRWYNDPAGNNRFHLGSNVGNDFSISGNDAGGLQFCDSSGDCSIVAGDTSGGLGFYTDGVNQRMRITSNGNVGIGTTTPSEKLEVHNGLIKITRDTNSAQLVLNAIGTGGRQYALLSTDDSNSTGGGNFALRDVSAGSYRLVVDSSGNVGIGTADPDTLLSLSGSDDKDAGPIATLHGDAINQTESGRIRFVEADGYYQGGFIHYNGAANQLNIGVHDSGNTLTSSDINAITIQRSNASVGIGTTSPDHPLDVNGDFRVGEAGSTNALFVDATNNKTGIGLNNPQATLQVWSGEAGISAAHADADELILESSGNTGLSLFAASTATSNIYFGRAGTSATDGRIVYDNNVQDLSLWTAGAEQLTIDSSGFVGIGTTSPDRELQIEGSGNVYAKINASTGNDSALELGETSAIWTLLNEGSGANEFKIRNDGGTRLTILDGGNVGIGTTSPQDALHVQGEDNNGTRSALRVQTTGTSDYLLLDSNEIDAAVDKSLYLNFNSSGSVILANGGGNVGIGTTTPQHNLSVSDTTGSSEIDITADDWATLYIDADHGGNGSIDPTVRFQIAGTEQWRVGVDQNDSNKFKIGYQGLNSTGITIQTDGDVGIGTTDPSDKLDVDGYIRADGLRTSALTVGGEMVYIRGTGLNHTGSRIIKIGNTTHVNSSGRGLGFCIFTASDHSLVSCTTYDTHGSSTDSDNLATALNNLTRDQIGILTSYDSWAGQVTSSLKDAANRLGLTKLAGAPTSSRTPYAAIFYGSGTSTGNTEAGRQAVEVLQSNDADAPYAIITTWMTEDGFTGQQLANALVSGNPDVSSPAVFVDGSGNVGIGTTSPGHKLSVSGSAFFDGGNVGIGTTTPGASLDVYGDGFSQFHVTGNSSSQAGGIYIGNDSSYTLALEVVGSATAGTSLRNEAVLYGRNSLDKIHIGSSRAQAQTTFDLSTGNVGIGTTSPDYKLHVDSSSGDVRSLFSAPTNSNAEIMLTERGGGTGVNNEIGAGLWYDGTDNAFKISTGNAGDIIDTAANTRLTILRDSGNVGIGTTTPDHLLTLGGSGDLLKIGTSGAVQPILGRDGTSGGLTIDTDGSVASENSVLSVRDNGGTDHFTILGGGNVGIGTTTPDSPFVIQSVSANPTLWAYQTNTVNSSGETLRLQRTLDAADSINKITFYDKSEYAADIRTIRDGSSTNWDLAFLTGSGSSSGGPSEQLRITSSGNVGIGTTSPSSHLAIDGSGTQLIRINTSSNSVVGTELNSPGGNWFSGLGQAVNDEWDIYDLSADASRLHIDSDGNIGIGESNPQATLDIAGSGSGSVDRTKGIRFDDGGDGDGAGIAAWNFNPGGSSSYRNLTFYATGWNGSSVVTRDILTIGNYEGNVGIGTTDPQEKLHLQESGASTVLVESTGDNLGYVIVDGDRSSTGDSVGNFRGRWNGTTIGDIRFLAGDDTSNKDEGDIAFYTAAGGSLSEQTRITQEGNVGIGTTSPARKLSVSDDGTYSAYFSGRVGIGVESPQTDLHVVGTSIFNGGPGEFYGVRIGGGESNDPFVQVGDWHNSSGVVSWDSSSNYLMIDSQHSTSEADIAFTGNDGATEYVRIKSTGKVGIGTTSPDSLLHVYGATPIAKVEASSGNAYLQITSATDSQSQVYLGDTDDSNIGRILYDQTDNYLALDTNNAERVRIDNAGNVGIGTTSPGAKLDVEGGIYAGAADLIKIQSESGFGTFRTTSSMRLATDANGIDIEAASFGITFDVGGTDRMFINSSGNVGIGTTSPDYPLDVNGDVRIGEAGSTNALFVDATSGRVGIGTTTPIDALHVEGGNAYFTNTQASATRQLYIDPATNGINSVNQALHLNRANSNNVIIGGGGGNVGIATTSTGYPLDVNGDFRVGEAGSTNALFVDATNGKVGIGTNSPADTLTILPTSAGVGLTIRESDDENDAVSLQGNAGNGNVVLYGGGGTARVMLRGAGDSFFNPSSGNVGIGTTSPMSKLSVKSTGNQFTLAYDDSNYTDIFTNSSGLLTLDSSGDRINLGGETYFLAETASNSNLYSLQLNRSNGTGVSPDLYGSSGASGLVFGADSSENSQLVLENGGNVGVGTSSPTAKFSVEGEAFIGGTGTTTIVGNLHVLGNIQVGTGTTYITSTTVDTGGDFRVNGVQVIDNNRDWQGQPIPYPEKIEFQSTSTAATALSNKTDEEAASILEQLETSYAAAIVNHSNLSAAKAASIFDDSTLSAAKAAEIFADSNLTTSKATSMLDHANLSYTRVNSIFDDTNITSSRIKDFLDTGSFTDADKIAIIFESDSLTTADAASHVQGSVYATSTMGSVFESSQLATSTAVNILGHANLNADGTQDVMQAMTSLVRIIGIITFEAPDITVSGDTSTSTNRYGTLNISSGTTTVTGGTGVIIADTITNSGAIDKSPGGGAGGSGLAGAGNGGQGGGGLLIIARSLDNDSIIQANGEDGVDATAPGGGGDNTDGSDGGGGALGYYRVGSDTIGDGGDGGDCCTGTGIGTGNAGGGGGGYDSSSGSGGDGAATSYTTYATAADFYTDIQKATVDWWIQNVASKSPSATTNFPVGSGAGGGGGATGNNSSRRSGGGGGSGGQIIVLADILDNTGGTIQANGGNGGDRIGDFSGGGGGAAGGLVYGLYRTSLVSSATLSASGGSRGTSNAFDGEDGTAGTTATYDVSGADFAELYNVADDQTAEYYNTLTPEEQQALQAQNGGPVGTGDIVSISPYISQEEYESLTELQQEAYNQAQENGTLAEWYMTEGSSAVNAPSYALRKSQRAYDSTAIGIIASQPAITIGPKTANSAPVALVGRVPVRIDSNSEPIMIGDPITSSGNNGMGMKATRRGQIVGKALESWTPTSGKSQIMVFVSLQWYDPLADGDSLGLTLDVTGTGASISALSITQNATSTSPLTQWLGADGSVLASLTSLYGPELQATSTLTVASTTNSTANVTNPLQSEARVRLSILGEVLSSHIVATSTTATSTIRGSLDLGDGAITFSRSTRELNVAGVLGFSVPGTTSTTTISSVLEEISSVSILENYEIDSSTLPTELLTASGSLDALKYTTFTLAGVQENDRRLTELESILSADDFFATSTEVSVITSTSTVSTTASSTVLGDLPEGFATTTIATTTGELITTSSNFMNKIVGIFSDLGVRIEENAIRFGNIFAQQIRAFAIEAENLTADVLNARVIYTKYIEVEGITTKDRATGEYYCIVVEHGAVRSLPGKCDEQTQSSVSTPDPVETVEDVTPTGNNTETEDTTATSTDTGVEEDTATSTDPVPTEDTTASSTDSGTDTATSTDETLDTETTETPEEEPVEEVTETPEDTSTEDTTVAEDTTESPEETDTPAETESTEVPTE